LYDRTDFVFGDIRDLSALRWQLAQRQVNTIFHLAGQASQLLSRVLPFETLNVNALGTYTALEAARLSHSVEAFLLASSGAVYGTTVDDRPLNEDEPLHAAANLYAPALVAAEAAVQSYALTFQMKAVICRAANTFGPGDVNFSRLVPRAMRNLLLNAPYQFGARDDGQSRLDFVYVEDLVRGYLKTAEWLHTQRPAVNETINLGTGYAHTTNALARMCSRAFDDHERTPAFTGPLQATPLIRYFNVSKAADLVGWRATTPLELALKQTATWYRNRVISG
jgi:CDP-glucose 4,6-dehydratase